MTELEEKEMDFAELLEADQSSILEGPLAPGDRVKGKVVLITSEAVFVDYGAKSEGWADIHEFKDEQGRLTVETGQEVELTFIGYGPSGVQLGNSLRGGLGVAGLALIRKAFEAHIPVEGTVTGTNKGGLEVNISGVKAFCPFSQMDLTYQDKPEALIGTTQKFLVSRYEEEGRNIVLSRRAVLLAEREAKAQALRERLAVGEVFSGRVTRLTPFGAFVDLGGLEGLIHVSEISRRVVKDPADILKEGQEVEVQVLEIQREEKGERIALSLKALEPDPWESDLPFEEGDILTGTVRNLVPYGAFVEIAPGLEGLVHISEISKKRIHHPREALKEGDTLEVMVLEINREQRRISLSIKEVVPFTDTDEDQYVEEKIRSGEIIRRRRKKTSPLSVLFSEEGAPSTASAPAGPPLPQVGWTGRGVIRSVKPYGYFVDLPELGFNQSGLLHKSETADSISGRAFKGWKEGDEVQVQIIRIGPQGKISLSQKAVLEQEDKQELTQFRERLQAKGKLGTLADLFNKKK